MEPLSLGSRSTGHRTERRTSGRSKRNTLYKSIDALPLSKMPMTYLGVIELERGHQYRTPDGVLITWKEDSLTVCEPNNSGSQAGTVWNVWEVKEVPPVLIDGLGHRTTLPTKHAIFVLCDGSKLLVGSAGTSPIAQIRYFYKGIPLSSKNISGYDANQITVFANAGLAREWEE